MGTIVKYQVDGSEASLQVRGTTRRKRPSRCMAISVEDGRRIIALRERGYSIRQIWVAVRANGRYTEEDIIDHVEAWRREEGWAAAYRALRGPQPPATARRAA